MFKFNLPKSTAYSLKKQLLTQNGDKNTKSNIFNDIFGISKEEITEIIKFSIPPKIPITIKKIQSHLKSKFGSNLNRKVIMNYLKKYLNYSFKKGSSTTYIGGSNNIYLQQIIYSCRILADIFNEKYIINIDESSI